MSNGFSVRTAVLAVLLLAPFSASSSLGATSDDNPFFAPYGTPFETPPFQRILPAHFLPALEKGMAEQKREVRAITMVRSVPTFENTIVAFDRSGALLERVSGVFGALRGAITNDQLDSIANIATPLLTITPERYCA